MIKDDNGKVLAVYIHAGCHQDETTIKYPEALWINYPNPLDEYQELAVMEKIINTEGRTFYPILDLLFE